MKTSNKLLLGSFIGILVICIAFLAVVKLALNAPANPVRTSIQKSKPGLKEISITNVNGLNLKGNWEARIVREDKEIIRVKGPEDLLETLWVNRSGNFLELHMLQKDNDTRKLHLEMTAPVIQALRIRGVADVAISGFNLEDFVIDAKGVATIHGEKGRARKLNFRGRGVSRLNLENFPTGNAELDCKGVVNIDLTMTGGDLSGKIKGAGNVRYKGAVNRESLQVRGACQVSRL